MFFDAADIAAMLDDDSGLGVQATINGSPINVSKQGGGQVIDAGGQTYSEDPICLASLADLQAMGVTGDGTEEIVISGETYTIGPIGADDAGFAFFPLRLPEA